MKKLKKPCIRKIEVYVRLYGGGATMKVVIVVVGSTKKEKRIS